MKNFFEIGIIFVTGLIISIVLYILTLSIIRSINPTLIIFFFSCVYIFIFSLVYLGYLVKKKYDLILSISLTINIAFITLIFAIFGPVFIDRSISYHIAFVVEEEKVVNAEELEEEWQNIVFEKRFSDGISSGMLIDNGNGTYSPTWRAKFFTQVMFLFGKLSNSLHDYETLKSKLKKVDKTDK